MTETQWLAGADPEWMAFWIYYRRPEPDLRKLQLLASACLRRIWHLLIDERCRRVIEMLEQSAEGAPTDEELHDLAHAGWEAMEEKAADEKYEANLVRAISDAGGATLQAADGDLQFVGNAARAIAFLETQGEVCYEHPSWKPAKDKESRAQADILYCIFGNPFRPLPLSHTWFTSNAKALAERIHNNRNLPAGTLDDDQMHLLADALEEAGCTNLAAERFVI